MCGAEGDTECHVLPRLIQRRNTQEAPGLVEKAVDSKRKVLYFAAPKHHSGTGLLGHREGPTKPAPSTVHGLRMRMLSVLK